jgi:hypothetical protein
VSKGMIKGGASGAHGRGLEYLGIVLTQPQLNGEWEFLMRLSGACLHSY